MIGRIRLDGAFTDSLRPYGSLGTGVLVSRAAADEREGDYEVMIEHEDRDRPSPAQR
jgi:hypothetical protein